MMLLRNLSPRPWQLYVERQPVYTNRKINYIVFKCFSHGFHCPRITTNIIVWGPEDDELYSALLITENFCSGCLL